MNKEAYDSFAGQLFEGRYRILKTIGIGGMSVVFEAFDLRTRRNVALKMLREEFAQDEQQIRRFYNESKAVSMLSHENIVKIYDISIEGKIKFIVMEYIEGITLKHYMTRRGVLSLNEIISYTEQILRALDHAHSRGVIHRDIKPQNIMLLKNGVIKVTDFGIAKIPNAETLTATDKAIGTVYYISPEQAEGKKTIDRRSDLYSLGVLMYEMSCGQLPFYDESPISVALMQIKNEPTPPKSINPSIPRGLEQIILSAMEKDPEVRFPSASQMLRQLLRLKADPNIVFRPGQKLEASIKKSDRNKARPEKKDSQKEKNEEKKPSVKKRVASHSMFPIILGVVSSFMLVLGVSLFFIIKGFLAGDSSIITLTVPSVVGYTYTSQDAVGLSSMYYEVTVKERYDSNSLKGQILDQKPQGGQRVKASAGKQRAKIELTVSMGAETVILENYENKSERDVIESLKALGLKFTTEKIHSDTIGYGKVCYTYPAAGETAVIGSFVTIYVSEGRSVGSNSVEVPDFRNGSETDARAFAEERGLKIKEVIYEESDKPKGVVIGQSLLPKTVVSRDTSITLTVSLGKAASEIKVPSITGLTVKQAEAELQKVGLKLGTRTEKESDIEEGRIIEQSPAAGTPISSDITSVSFTVSLGTASAGSDIEYMEIDGFKLPNIIGMSVNKARKILEECGMSLGTGVTVVSDKPIGTVVNVSVSYDINGNAMIDYEVSIGVG